MYLRHCTIAGVHIGCVARRTDPSDASVAQGCSLNGRAWGVKFLHDLGGATGTIPVKELGRWGSKEVSAAWLELEKHCFPPLF